MKIAVHLHIFYSEQIDEMVKYLQNICGAEYDLFVTVIKDFNYVQSKIKAFKSDAKIVEVSNRGYDVGPFIEFINRIDLSKYDYVLKLHTKNRQKDLWVKLNNRRFNNALWHSLLLDALLKTPERFVENCKLFMHYPYSGLVASAYCLTNEQKTYQDILPQINDELSKMGFAVCQTFYFVAGTMFMARADLLRPLQKYSIADFAPTDGSIKHGTKAHVFERLFGAIIEAQGFKLCGITDNRVCFSFMFQAARRFLFQTKNTQNGYRLFKVCKIPVYRKKQAKTNERN